MRRTIVLCLLAALLIPAAALAASTNQIIRDCADDGVLEGHYTPAELRKARDNLPTDVNEYSDCSDVLARAAGAAATAGPGGGGAGGPGGAGGTFLPGTIPGGAAGADNGDALVTPATEADHRAVAEAAAKGAPSVKVGGRTVMPGSTGLAADAARNGLPRTLLVVLVLLGAAALAAAAPFIRRYVLARRRR